MSPDPDHFDRIYKRIDDAQATMIAHGEDIASLKTLNEQQMNTLTEMNERLKIQPNVCTAQKSYCETQFKKLHVGQARLQSKFELMTKIVGGLFGSGILVAIIWGYITGGH